MESIKANFEELFEDVINYPDIDYLDRLNSLVGLNEHKDKLIKLIGTIVNPLGLTDWIKKHHPGAKKIIDLINRPPLIIFSGDVGSGKTELASTIGDSVARRENINIILFPLSLSTRGQGRVGQMTQLISSAFDYTIEKAKKFQDHKGKSKGAIILLVDEADALAHSRENNQMHHEDKAGVNAFIRGIDSLKNGKLPVVVIMCTNRPNSLDPAIKRRAAEIFYFKRPSAEERFIVLNKPLSELGLNKDEIDEIVKLTGQINGREYSFTYSDLRQRLLPAIIFDAYPEKAVQGKRAIEITKSIVPTEPFKEI